MLLFVYWGWISGRLPLISQTWVSSRLWDVSRLWIWHRDGQTGHLELLDWERGALIGCPTWRLNPFTLSESQLYSPFLLKRSYRSKACIFFIHSRKMYRTLLQSRLCPWRYPSLFLLLYFSLSRDFTDSPRTFHVETASLGWVWGITAYFFNVMSPLSPNWCFQSYWILTASDKSCLLLKNLEGIPLWQQVPGGSCLVRV